MAGDVGLEAEASLIREYAAELVPGLLQTEDYYREFLSTAPADPGTARILELGALQGVTVQVLPFTAGAHPAMEGPFSILGFPEPVDPDVVYLENQAGSVYLEDADEIDRYAQVITHLIARALSPDDSASLIRNVAASL